MDLIILEDIFFKEYIEKYVPTNILDLKPVIAGGSVLSIYLDYYYRDHYRSKKSNNLCLLEISDFDCWFLKNNAHEDIDFLLKDFQNVKTKNENIFALKKNKFYCHRNIVLNEQDKQTVSRLRIGTLLKETEFANTFFTEMPTSTEIQFIKMSRPETIFSLLDDFDINICKIAYYDGNIYMHPDFLSGFENKKIISKQYPENFYEAIHASQRRIKYFNKMLRVNLNLENKCYLTEIVNSIPVLSFSLSQKDYDFILETFNNLYTEEQHNLEQLSLADRSYFQEFSFDLIRNSKAEKVNKYIRQKIPQFQFEITNIINKHISILNHKKLLTLMYIDDNDFKEAVRRALNT